MNKEQKEKYEEVQYSVNQIVIDLEEIKKDLEKNIKNKKDDIQNLVNTIEALEDKLIDLHKDKTQEEKDDLNYELANILDDNYVYDLVRNKETKQ
jgi:hypothetical protein